MTATHANEAATDPNHVVVEGVADRVSNNGTRCQGGRDAFIAWLTASCQRQSVPLTITDPTLLATVASLLR